MKLFHTRGKEANSPEFVSFTHALLHPAADFGGLYAPKTLPKLSRNDLQKLATKNYKELAKSLLVILEADLDDALIEKALATYDAFDDKQNPVPVTKLNDQLFVSELWHGPTRAFKDMALAPFGTILSELAVRQNERYLILAATSGDTGPAALKSFENKPNTEVVCLYPDGGTSDVQRLQMVTMSAKNLKVLGIHGDFDDAQNALKSLLNSGSFNEFLAQKSIKLSAANSVNFGRILFQIIYHFYSYFELVRRDEIELGTAVDMVVPSGNFGNALGAYYALKMGLPIGKIIIASNNNNVLTDLIVTGRYDLNTRKLAKTCSPAMDILKSSNVERILFDLYGEKRTKELMEDLNSKNSYELTENELEALREVFDAAWSNGIEVKEAIRESALKGYILDPHTATCIKASKLGSSRKKILYSTAEWTKFSPTLASAIGTEACSDKEALALIGKRYNAKVPAMIDELFHKEIVQKDIIEKERIEETIKEFLN